MKKAFTIIELLVAISIVIIFIGISLPRYNDFTEQTKLKNESKKLTDVLELARKKALTSDLFDKNCSDFTGYKITIAPTSYSLSFGCASVYSLVQSYNLPTSITATIGTGDFIFSRLMKSPSFISDTIRLTNSSIGRSIVITISPIGIIELDETLL